MKTKSKNNSQIRTDLYAVKSWDGFSQSWTYTLVTSQFQLAKNEKKSILMDKSLGLTKRAKIVHPSQNVVNAYVIAGNSIDYA